MANEVTENKGAGHYLLSEANGTLSREEVTIASGQNLASGAVVGIVTGSGEYAMYDNDAVDGTETVAGVLYEAVDATSAAQAGVVHDYHAEVKQDELVWKDVDAQTAGEPQFAALNIKLR